MVMMYTSLKFESEEAARSQVEPLQIQPRLMATDGCVLKRHQNSFCERFRKFTNHAYGNGRL